MDTAESQYNNLPEEYTKETWPNPKRPPKVWLHEFSQQYRLKKKFEHLVTTKEGPFLCQLTVTWPQLPTVPYTFKPKNHSRSKQDAEHNAALQFLLNPPQWVVDVCSGKEPDLSSEGILKMESTTTSPSTTSPTTTSTTTSPETTSPTTTSTTTSPTTTTSTTTSPATISPTTTSSTTSPETTSTTTTSSPTSTSSTSASPDTPAPSESETAPAPSESENDDLDSDEEIVKPQVIEGIELPRCPDQAKISIGAPEFTTQQFIEDRKLHPEKFIDTFGDGRHILQIIEEGTHYPDTGARVDVHVVIKRASDNKIFENTFASKTPRQFRLREAEVVECLDIAAQHLKVGGKALVLSHWELGFGICGFGDIIPPKEDLLLYIELVRSIAYTPLPDDIHALHQKGTEERLSDATNAKEEGTKFYNQKIFKIALDYYWQGFRQLYYQKDKWRAVKPEDKDKINKMKVIMLSNIAAVHTNWKDWRAVVTHCDTALEIDPTFIRARERRARALGEMELFERAKADVDYLLANGDSADKERILDTYNKLQHKATQRTGALFKQIGVKFFDKE